MSQNSKPSPADVTPVLRESTLPPELEMAIFLLTARTHKSACVDLMLVASHVKYWIEPVLYKTVVLRGTAHAIRFLGSLSDYRSPEFAKTHVKALCIHPSIPLRLTLQLLTACSGLETLALWTRPPLQDTTELVHLLSSLPLTSLSLSLPTILPPNAPRLDLQNHPIFVNLTHLDVVDHWVLWTSSLGIEHLSLLTHLAFRFWSRGSVNGALSTILSQSPKLRVLVLLADIVVIPGAKEYLQKQGVRDVRVVVLRHARDVDEWVRIQAGAESMWERAERIVRWRLRNHAGPFDFPAGFAFGCSDGAAQSVP